MMHPIEGATKTPLNGCVRNNDAFTAGRAVAHLTHALSQKVWGRCGDILGRSGDALAHSGDTPGRSMTLQDAPGRSGTLRGRFGGHSGGLCGHFGDGWMMLMMVVAMVMAMAKIFAFRFYISKLPINRLRGRYVSGFYINPRTFVLILPVVACLIFFSRLFVKIILPKS